MASKPKNKTNAKIKASNHKMNLYNFKESVFDAINNTLEVILIESGFNDLKKRLYPTDTILNADSFAGLKMFSNHQTVKEENERPEGDVTKWVATILEDWNVITESNTVQRRAKIEIIDPWLQERLTHQSFKEKVGLSINTSGDISFGKHNDERVQIVDKIFATKTDGVASVDLVTEAGARGRILLNESMFDSVVDTQLKEKEEPKMADKLLKEAKFADLLAENPALLQEAKQSVLSDLKSDDAIKQAEATIKESQDKLKESQAKVVEFEKANEIALKQAVIESCFKDCKLHETSVTKLKESAKSINESGDKLKESIKKLIEAEATYLNELSKAGKISLSESTTTKKKDGKPETLVESLTNKLLKEI